MIFDDELRLRVLEDIPALAHSSVSKASLGFKGSGIRVKGLGSRVKGLGIRRRI